MTESTFDYWRKQISIVPSPPVKQLIALPLPARRADPMLELQTPHGMVDLVTGHHDMRKPINGLALVVAETLGLRPVGVHWLVIYNRERRHTNHMVLTAKYADGIPLYR